MRKISILYILSLAIMTAIIIYSYTNRAEITQIITTPQPTQVDTEKQQLKTQLQALQQENITLQENNKRLKWYMNTFFEPKQVEYMKRRSKQ